MSAFNFLDIPSTVFLHIISFLKDVTPLRLVCRSFNIYVCEVMFNTLVIKEGPCREPLERPCTRFLCGPVMSSTGLLTHQLDTLYTKKQPAALRRAKALKILVSPLFRCSESLSVDTIDQFAIHKELQSRIHELKLKLPSIIRTLGNLRETTIYLSEFEPEEFTHDISNALLTLPHLTTLNVNFFDQNFFRSLPIVGSPRLVTMKISWPLRRPNSLFPPGPKSNPVYSQICGLTTKNTSLKYLELRSANLLSYRDEPYQLCALPCLEELVIDNVPVLLSGDNVKEMRELQSLRLAYGRFACPNSELCAEVWKSLKEVGTKLKRLSIDMVGEALLTYLRSYAGLETLELKLDRDAEHSYAQDLFKRSLQHHEGSLKSLQVNLQPQSNPLSTWFLEYWKEWIPPLSNLERLEVATSMNLFSEYDAEVLVKHITDVVALIPTLRIVTIHHPHEYHFLFPEEQKFTKAMRERVGGTRVHGDYTALVPQCVVQIIPLFQTFSVEFHREGGYGFLKLV